MRDSTAAKRPALSRRAIVAAGVELADEIGVDALTMRSLAERLGFKVMALYNHIAGKDELLAAMVDAVAAEVEAPPEDLPPLEAVRALALGTRETLRRHPWAPQIWQRYLPGPARIDQMESLLRCFDRSGLGAELAHHGFHAVTNHVLGYTLQEQALAFDSGDPDDATRARAFVASLETEAHPLSIAHVQEHLDGETSSSFELVLDLILDGLVRLDEASSGRL